jgi:hypothetical protein
VKESNCNKIPFLIFSSIQAPTHLPHRSKSKKLKQHSKKSEKLKGEVPWPDVGKPGKVRYHTIDHRKHQSDHLLQSLTSHCHYVFLVAATGDLRLFAYHC